MRLLSAPVLGQRPQGLLWSFQPLLHRGLPIAWTVKGDAVKGTLFEYRTQVALLKFE